MAESKIKIIFAAIYKDMELERHLSTAKNTAMLTSNADVTMFQYGDLNIQFKTSPYLEKYTRVKEWDNGYIVVMAKYKGVGEVEEYIDLVPILDNLYIDKDKFLSSIKAVEINYD